MQHARDTGRYVSVDWHAFRELARRTESSPEVFSEIEQTTYDLDTARITGAEDRRAFVEQHYGTDKEVDVREANPRRM